MRRQRPGARGIRRIKTGCQTCKIRHKKCDEKRPSCFPCSNTGRRCDFEFGMEQALPGQAISTQRLQLSFDLVQSSLPNHNDNNTGDLEGRLYEFFRVVCAKDFSIYFGEPCWESLVLRTAYTEPSIYHAALAISSVSRDRYFVTKDWYDPIEHTKTALQYSLLQYNEAIRLLNARLDESIQSIWLATLASIIFIQIHHLQDNFDITSIHLEGGLSLLPRLKYATHNIEHFEQALNQVQSDIAYMERLGKI